MTAMLTYLSNLWNVAALGVADHLWQSTLFAIVAALLTLMLRGHSARIRYLVWLAASLKFLMPFSLLVAFGSWLSPGAPSAPAHAGVHLVEDLVRPFTQTPSPIRPAMAATINSVTPLHSKAILPGLWLCGSIAVFFIWIVRWWRICLTRRRATTLLQGREVSALKRLEDAAGMRTQLKLLLSPAPLEPGVFGIFRPVLLWPNFISEHLDDSHLDAVLAHELCHVQRQDNLAAALHMLVETLFWFHPLVWWLGRCLIEERERACDEAVVEIGSYRQTYAESILKVCELCLSSSLTCVSGVTGSDLKKRMVHIMTDRIVRKFDFTRKLLLWAAASLALIAPIVYGLFNPSFGRADTALGTAPRYRYVTVSVKPHPPEADGANRSRMMMSVIDASFTATDVTAQQLIQIAYHVQDSQIAGAPDWFNSAKYDLEARVDSATAAELHKLSEDQRGGVGQQLLQGLLADQFKLSVHQEARDLPVYELTVAEGGTKLQKAGDHGFMHLAMGELSSNGTPLALLAAQLSTRLGRMVVDKTGLTGNYAYSLRWTPDSEEQARMQAAGGAIPATFGGKNHHAPIPPASASSSSPAPPLLTAVQEQLGLVLEPRTDRVQVLVIDRIEQPVQE